MASNNQIGAFLIFFVTVVVLRQLAVHIVEEVHADELEKTSGKSSGNIRGSGSDQICKAYEGKNLFQQAVNDFRRYNGFKYSPLAAQYGDFCETVAKSYACLTIQIIDGRMYVKHFFPGYQSRHRGTLHLLYRVQQRFGKLPNAQFAIEVTDGVFGAVDMPVFVITRLRNNPNGILYPDFTFYSWPEAVCPPERSHAHGFLMALYKREKDKMDSTPDAYWGSKQDTLFWRGGIVGNPIRKQVVDTVKGPDIDLAFMQWHSTSLTGVNGAPGCVGLIDHCKYKYLAFLQGNTYSSRLKYQLLCGSCVFASKQPWIEWWTQLLVPFEDLIEVADDWSDATQKLAMVKSSPDGGRQIAKNGQKKTLDILSEDAVDCYWLKLIELAAEHLPQPEVVDVDNLPHTMKPIEDALLYSNDVVVGSRELKGPVIPVR